MQWMSQFFQSDLCQSDVSKHVYKWGYRQRCECALGNARQNKTYIWSMFPTRQNCFCIRKSNCNIKMIVFVTFNVIYSPAAGSLWQVSSWTVATWTVIFWRATVYCKTSVLMMHISTKFTVLMKILNYEANWGLGGPVVRPLAARAKCPGFDSPITQHVQRLISRPFTYSYGAVGPLVLSWSWAQQPGFIPFGTFGFNCVITLGKRLCAYSLP